MHTPTERMRRYVAQAIRAAGGINALGRLVGVNGSSVLAWSRGEALPGLDKIPVLSVILREDREQLRAVLVDALEERAEHRRYAPRPIPPPRGRRTLGAVALAVGLATLGGAAEGSVPPLVDQTPSYRTRRPPQIADQAA
jgi:hypothetical protein